MGKAHPGRSSWYVLDTVQTGPKSFTAPRASRSPAVAANSTPEIMRYIAVSRKRKDEAEHQVHHVWYLLSHPLPCALSRRRHHLSTPCRRPVWPARTHTVQPARANTVWPARTCTVRAALTRSSLTLDAAIRVEAPADAHAVAVSGVPSTHCTVRGCSMPL